MPTSAELYKKLEDERAGLAKLFTDATKEGEKLPTLGADGVKRAQEWNKAIGDLAKEAEEAKAVEDIQATNETGLKALRQPTDRIVGPDGRVLGKDDDDQPNRKALKSLGEMFVESHAYTERPRTDGATGPELRIDLGKTYGKKAWAGGLKTIFDTAASFAIQNVRLPAPITPGEQPVTVASLMPEGRTSGSAVAYMEETTTTPAAAEVAESGSKPEAAIAFTEKTSTVRKIAVQIPVTDESLADVPFIESYIDSRLRIFLQQREDTELLVGSGAGVNIRGLNNVVGIQTQAKGADATPTAVYKAMTLIRSVGFLEPSGAIFHPLDWQDIRTLQDSTGNYIWGQPWGPGIDRIWGLEVVQTVSQTQNTGLIGAFRTAAEIFRRQEVTMQVGWINDQFIKNQRTILVEERLALVAFRPKGFCTVTGI